MKTKCSYCKKSGHQSKYCKKRIFIDRQPENSKENLSDVVDDFSIIENNKKNKQRSTRITKEQLIQMIKETFLEEQTQQQVAVQLPPQAQQVVGLIEQTGKAMSELAKVRPDMADFLKASWAQMAAIRTRLKH